MYSITLSEQRIKFNKVLSEIVMLKCDCCLSRFSAENALHATYFGYNFVYCSNWCISDDLLNMKIVPYRKNI
jgi:hypothetical protein